MHILNIEIKARCSDPAPIRAYLTAHRARYVGEDHQRDTYFRVPNGRLKLREGPIERALIQYHRGDQEGPKRSDVTLVPLAGERSEALRRALEAALGVLVVVEKRRHIYFIDNVKFHLDDVAGLGTFVEIEAIDTDGTRDADALEAQCRHYLEAFGVDAGDLVAVSYSDLLLRARAGERSTS